MVLLVGAISLSANDSSRAGKLQNFQEKTGEVSNFHRIERDKDNYEYVLIGTLRRFSTWTKKYHVNTGVNEIVYGVDFHFQSTPSLNFTFSSESERKKFVADILKVENKFHDRFR